MDDALAEWLRLREVADWAARSAPLAHQVADRLPTERPVRVLDLATGTGSNLRYLMTRLPSPQHWLLVDRSADLLRLVGERTSAWAASRGYRVEPIDRGLAVHGSSLACVVETRILDLNLPLAEELFAGRHLVTASALLDLVSEAWLTALAGRCRTSGAAALFALSYDGRSAFSPPEPDDEWVRTLLNEHQHRDKGLGGPGAGPSAHLTARRCFLAAGFSCRDAPTDWSIGPDEEALQRQLIEGLATAAVEERPDAGDAVAAWLTRRLAHLAGGQSRATVGHHDLAAWLPGT
ncbi:MAG TPA: class I SAM-dependent methyltransferase [Vicinamibacterales bacterium]|nr:class I SAM-dependent methyltransferase [Vicinamibacterales bacterium]